MTLLPGTRVGAYEIQSAIGAGGMGEVYRARDTRLHRDVAIKVLPASFAADRERLSRFEREAQVLASLNHPHIAHVYGLEEAGPSPGSGPATIRALVMELVDGATLEERLSAGAVPVDEAVAIARQIADALEAAHEAGIVHRDLKPANIKLRADGSVKVLDFGLAKALDAPGVNSVRTESPTIISPAMTHAGVILGTAAYMSPEQARGKAVDKRADIWAFGVVLHEMLTGRRLFQGETVTDTLAEVLKREIDLRAVPPETPTNVRRLLARCLERDPKKRLRDIGDAIVELDESPSDAAPIAAPRARRSGALLVAALAAVAIAAALSAFAAWTFAERREAPRHVIRVQLDVPRGGSRPTMNRPQIAISPNGRYIAALSGFKVVVRRTDDITWSVLDGTDGAVGVFFSPDSEWIGYWTPTEIKRMPVTGGPSVVITGTGDEGVSAAVVAPNAATWADDGTVYYAQATQGILAVSAAGGTPTLIVQGSAFSAPYVPRGTRVLLYVRSGQQIALHPLDGGDDIVLETGRSPRYMPSGSLIFARDDTLFAVPFDPAARKVGGTPMPVQQGVALFGVHSQYDISADGTLVYIPGTAAANARSVLKRVNRAGLSDGIAEIQRGFSDPRVSPDGGRLALHLTDQQDDIWIQDLVRGPQTRFTFDAREDETPVWSPDGGWIAWSGFVRGSDDRAVFRRPADGSGVEEVLWSGSLHAHVTDWTPDGRRLVLEVAHPQRRGDIQVLNLSESRDLQPFAATNFDETSGRVSPDGRWLAYQTDESGRYEIYVQRFPAGGGKILASAAGGVQPVWSRDGRELYYRTPTDVMRVSVSAGDTVTLGAPVAMFKDVYERIQADNHTTYDVLPDGRFVFIQRLAISESTVENPYVMAVFNWAAELRQKLGR